jgi:hypothetical protein
MKKNIKILPLDPNIPRAKNVEKIPLTSIRLNEDIETQKENHIRPDNDSIYVPLEKKD